MKQLRALFFLCLTLTLLGYTALEAQAPAVCRIDGPIYNALGQPHNNLKITIRNVEKSGVMITRGPIVYRTNKAGEIVKPDSLKLIQGATAFIEANIGAPGNGFNIRGGAQITIPTQTICLLVDLMPASSIISQNAGFVRIRELDNAPTKAIVGNNDTLIVDSPLTLASGTLQDTLGIDLSKLINTAITTSDSTIYWNTAAAAWRKSIVIDAGAASGDMLRADFADSLRNNFLTGATSGSPAAGDTLLAQIAGVITRIDIGDLPSGGGETNTASNLGGGLANFDSKSGSDLRFNSFLATDFNLAANQISLDRGLAATWTAVHSFADNNLQINNPANTFQYIFGTATLAADRIMELPLLTGGDTFTFNDFAATLTNKTINTSSNTITVVEADISDLSHTPNTADIADVSVTQSEFAELETIGGTIISAGNWTGVSNLSGTNTGDEVAATLTVQGIIEIATGAETNTGTDATRAVSPDGLDDWTGSARITTLGTISGGIWNGTAVTYANLNFSNNIVAGDIAAGAVTNVEAANMAAFTFKMRNNSGTGDPQDVKISALTDRAAFGSGDKLIIEESTGEIRKVDFDDLPGAGGGLSNIVEDTTPQLGGDLDANTFDIQFDDATGIRDDSDNEQLIFQKTASAINHFEFTNAAAGGEPLIAAVGGDTDVSLTLDGKGAGTVRTLSSNLDITGNILVSGTVDGVDIAARDHAEANDLEAIDPPNVEANEVYVGTGSGAGAWNSSPTLVGLTLNGVADFGAATSVEIPNGAGGTTVNAAGEVTIDTTPLHGSFNFFDSTEESLTPVITKTWVIEDPVANDSTLGAIRFPFATTIDSVICVLTSAGGASTDTININFKHGTNRSLLGPGGSGTKLFSSDQEVNNNTTGNAFSTFNDATVTTNTWIAPYVVTKGGTVSEWIATVYLTKDP